MAGSRTTCKVTTEGRECCACRVFKLWKFYYKSKTKSATHRSRCKDCCKIATGKRPAREKSAKKAPISRTIIENFLIYRTHLRKNNEEKKQKA